VETVAWVVVEPAAASPSCPRCGAESPAGESRCRACGFAFFEASGRRRVPLPSRRVLAPAAAVLAAAGVLALVAGADDPPARTVPVSDRDFPRRLPSPLPARDAERLLELRYGGRSGDTAAAVRCPHRIDPEGIVRCELRYSDGVPRALLVRLSPRGELEADIPYPATLR
jgi:hypothetical protein